MHADCKYPRFNEFDFQMRTLLGDITGASFADWPFTYDELEPYYAAAERLVGVQGKAGANPFESRRSGEFPMPPGPAMYGANVIADGAASSATRRSRIPRRSPRATIAAGRRATTAASAAASVARPMPSPHLR